MQQLSMGYVQICKTMHALHPYTRIISFLGKQLDSIIIIMVYRYDGPYQYLINSDLSHDALCSGVEHDFQEINKYPSAELHIP